MKKFREVFEKYIDENLISPVVYNAEITDIKINSVLRTLEIGLKLNELLSREDLHNAEKAIAKSDLALSKAVINPEFNDGLFSADYFKELVCELKYKIPRINGTFKNSEVILNGDTLNITLNNGGKTLLDSVEFDVELAKLVYKEFKREIKVTYDGVTTIDGESEEYIASQENAEKKIKRENLEKIAEMFEDEETSAKESASKRAENNSQEIEVRKGKFLTPQIIPTSVRPLYGRSGNGKIIPISNVLYDSGKVNVWGDVFAFEKRVTRSGDKNIITIDITDYTGSITVKVFGPIKNTKIVEEIKVGDAIVVSGDVEFDKFAGGIVINAKSISTAQKVKVVDKAPKKRVELHLHTNMSQMDGMTPAKELINRAASWGHPAIAITDHGVAQAFPEAMNTAKKLNKDEEKIKILYGTEAYFIDDLVESVVGAQNESLDGTFICFDIETTGLSARKDRITEIGAVKVVNGDVQYFRQSRNANSGEDNRDYRYYRLYGERRSVAV